METKAALRKKFRKQRADLGKEQIAGQSELVKRNFAAWFQSLHGLGRVHIFLPIERLQEVNTYLILDFLREVGVEIYSSIILPGTDVMRTVHVHSDTEFVLDDWGIPIPKEVDYCEDGVPDLVLVPLLAIDQIGNRLGYGKGFYDGYLGNLPSRVVKTGLGFFEPMKALPMEDHDVTLDYYISPSQVYRF